MVRKLLFSAFAALVLAGGLLMASAFPGSAAPMMSPVTQAQPGNNVIPVAACGPWNNWCRPRVGPDCGPWNNWCGQQSQCGPWNNWCKPSSGGGCITVGGVQLCVGGTGSNCHWYNGARYCNNGPGPSAGSCVFVNGARYCSYKRAGDCIRVNGRRYCRY
jgi:hypothetical protein